MGTQLYVSLVYLVAEIKSQPRFNCKQNKKTENKENGRDIFFFLPWNPYYLCGMDQLHIPLPGLTPLLLADQRHNGRPRYAIP